MRNRKWHNNKWLLELPTFLAPGLNDKLFETDFELSKRRHACPTGLSVGLQSVIGLVLLLRGHRKWLTGTRAVDGCSAGSALNQFSITVCRVKPS